MQAENALLVAELENEQLTKEVNALKLQVYVIHIVCQYILINWGPYLPESEEQGLNIKCFNDLFWSSYSQCVNVCGV